MAGDIRRHGGGSRAAPRKYGLEDALVGLWDLSKSPFETMNDRDVKLGNYASGLACAVARFDKITKRVTIADGLTGAIPSSPEQGAINRPPGAGVIGPAFGPGGALPIGIPDGSSGSPAGVIGPGNTLTIGIQTPSGNKPPQGAGRTIRPFEPDNWLLRYHEHKGIARDKVWSLRLIVDHTNKAEKSDNRSTPVIDQCDHQRQGTLQDVFWGTDIETDVGDVRNIIGPSGYPQILNPKFGDSGKETGVRLALAFNVAKNAGFITDGVNIGQLWHIFSIGKQDEAGSTTTSECQPKEKKEGLLRGDVQFHVGTDLCHLGISDEENTDPECGQPYIGRLFVRDEKSAKGPSKELSKDPNSNHKELKRKLKKSLWVLIRVPEDSNAVPTGGNPGSAPGGTGGSEGTPIPTKQASADPALINAQPPQLYSGDSTGSARPGAKMFKAGDYQVEPYDIPVRNPIESGTFQDIQVLVRPTAAYGGGEKSSLTFMYKVLPRGADATAILFKEIDKEIDSTFTKITKDGWNQLMFRIPAADLAGAAGGSIQAYLFMISDSSGPDLVLAA